MKRLALLALICLASGCGTMTVCFASDCSAIYRQAGADVMRYAMAMPASADAADLRMIHRAVVLQQAADAAEGPQGASLCSEDALATAGRWGDMARAKLAAMDQDRRAAQVAERYPDVKMIRNQLDDLGRSVAGTTHSVPYF